MKKPYQTKKQEKKLKKKNKPLDVSGELAKVFKENSEIELCFYKFTLSKQREFAEYVSEAKREETRFKRLDKVIPMITNGKGLNDRYRKSSPQGD